LITELQVWVLILGCLFLAMVWLLFVAWIRIQALKLRRQPQRIEVAGLGPQPPGEGDNLDWQEAEREAMMRASATIRRQRTEWEQ
jgi:hypothetical protein